MQKNAAPSVEVNLNRLLAELGTDFKAALKTAEEIDPSSDDGKVLNAALGSRLNWSSRPRLRRAGRRKGSCEQAIIAGGDAPEVFQSAEAALDDIAPLICALVETVESYSVGFVWDHRLCPAVDNVGAKVIAVVALVRYERRYRRSKRKKCRCGGDIGVLTGSEMKCARSTIRIAQRVNFRGASAARVADRLFVLPPFPPLADRCALIEVESIDKVMLCLPQLAKASKIAPQRPLLDQRLKRL